MKDVVTNVEYFMRSVKIATNTLRKGDSNGDDPKKPRSDSS